MNCPESHMGFDCIFCPISIIDDCLKRDEEEFKEELISMAFGC